MTKIIETVQVEKVIEQTYTRKVKKKMDLKLDEISDQDIDLLDNKSLHIVTRAFKKLYLEYKDIALEQDKLLKSFAEDRTTNPPAMNDTKDNDADSQNKSDKELEGGYDTPERRKTLRSSPVHNNMPIGTKRGKTSKYHYVYWNKNHRKWVVVMDKRHFDSEVEAALYSDALLDKRGDTLRPRNRNKHPEIRELYEQVVQDET